MKWIKSIGNLLWANVRMIIMKSNCRWNPLRTRKNRSPRWDLNPQPSVIYADALTTELLETVASKGEMWVFDSSCITQLHSEIIKSHLGLGSFRVLSGFHQEINFIIYEIQTVLERLRDSVQVWPVTGCVNA